MRTRHLKKGQCTIKEIIQMKNTPQNQYFPANAERMSIHCFESGCIGKYIPLRPRGYISQYIPPLGSVQNLYYRCNENSLLI